MPAPTDGERRFAIEELRALVEAVFRACDMGEADAALLTDSLIASDRRGVHSHGVLRVPEYVKKLTVAGVNPRGRPRIVRETGGCVTVDGDNSMGQIGSTFAMRRVLELAREHGIAAGVVRGSNHSGAMAYYAMMALPHNMIGIATTNCLPTMPAHGGAERLLGINPLGVAIPADAERPIVYDAAFSGSSHGKIRVYAQKGLPIPEGWALDAEGRPTTDVQEAIDGLLAPIGGFKGVGLALICGTLGGLLSGAAWASELGSLETGPIAGRDGHFVAAIDIAAFEDVARFKSRVDGVIRSIHASKRAPGVARLYAPGEPEALYEDECQARGVPLNAETAADLFAAARSLGVAVEQHARG